MIRNLQTALKALKKNIIRNLQTALKALKNNNTVTTLNLARNNIGVNLQEIENLLERNRKMKQVYLSVKVCT